MRKRLESLLLVADGFGLWRYLPAAAVMLIAVFAWSLAVAAPISDKSRIASAPSIDALPTSPATIPFTNGTVAYDGASPAEIAIFSAPIAAPHYHDRYRFYHRYDLNDPRARLTPPAIDLD